MTSHSERKLARVSEVAEWLGGSKSTIYKWTQEGIFPKPIVLGGADLGKNTASRWIVAEIDEWLRTRERNRFSGE